ncbi:MAG TPA: M20/M25/M40 family metallo-hydrolase [Bryobacteraceae bacterium]|nr:M20/M25/M40 family metallo-hydrolase [Bryobacteraceae bacterium]
MRRSALHRFVTAMLLLACSAHAADRYPVRWDKVHPETIEHFTHLLHIDSSNPPGNETQVASYVKSVLDREGISAQLFALDPARANVVARIKGNGSKKPILVMGHSDTVGVQRENWSVDPFAAIRKNGFIYGRGAQDDKDTLTAGLMLMLLLKRLNVKLDRDVIFLSEAGEEGTAQVGINFMVERHWDEIDAEYALAEGGYVSARNGKVRFIEIATTEKVPRGLKVVAHGASGHGSRPRPDNAIIRLAAAIAKFGSWQPPMRLNDTTRAYFERLAAISPAEEAWRYTHITERDKAPQIERYFAEHEIGHYSILRTTVTPTMIKGGFRMNVIPSEAEAFLDVRALPDEDMDQLRAQIRHVLADSNVDVLPAERGERPAGPPSRIDTEMFHALERVQQRMFPGAITLPAMLTGATDMAQLRTRGVQAYGIGPIVDEADGGSGGAHADDERLAETSIEKLVEFLWYTVLDAAASPN